MNDDQRRAEVERAWREWKADKIKGWENSFAVDQAFEAHEGTAYRDGYLAGDANGYARSNVASDPFEMVLEFHNQFGLVIGQDPTFPDDQTTMLRSSLVDEEAHELLEAIAQRDLIGVADALADLLYVVYGAAITFGIDIRPVFAEVHRTNMAKEGGPTRKDGKILKPHGWQPPNIASVLRGIHRRIDPTHTRCQEEAANG